MKKAFFLALAFCLVLLAETRMVFAAESATDVAVNWDRAVQITEGVRYTRLVYEQPRKMKGYAMRIDLSNPTFAFTANGRDPEWGKPMPDYTNGTIRTQRVTVRDFLLNAREPVGKGGHGLDMIVAFNTAPWGPWRKPFTFRYGDPHGYNVSNGEMITDNHDKGQSPVFVIWKNGTASILPSVPTERRSDVWISHAGFDLILKDGKPLVNPKQGSYHPRMVLGLSADRRWLYVLAVDGRQKNWSIGADYWDLAKMMLRLGATDAINMDGGGSTTLMYWDEASGTPVTCNRPTEASDMQRPCALNIGIYRKAKQ
ncbi:MAG: phosphodiester glycosidase family protein [Kiritimatiellae bacterium]|nr:phosphodiester glycosidase family protein [Kiritimatiellia bacterium]